MSKLTANIIAHSITTAGKEMVTFEWEYPRFIHAEVMTHRALSKNAASSRAIPIKKMIKLVEDDPAMPHVWGKNQAGMQADYIFLGNNVATPKWAWLEAMKGAVKHAKVLDKIGLHKQIVNRVLEPFSTMKTVITGTEWNNWYWLRDHEDAQPEIALLAAAAKEAYECSEPTLLAPGQWHMPYVDNHVIGNEQVFFLEGSEVSIETALKVSASCCAQVSYRVLDGGLDKAETIYESLVESEPVHASPFEHQGKVMYKAQANDQDDLYAPMWEEGITHIDRLGRYGSGNLQGYIQHRQLIPNNVKRG